MGDRSIGDANAGVPRELQLEIEKEGELLAAGTRGRCGWRGGSRRMQARRASGGDWGGREGRAVGRGAEIINKSSPND